LIQGGHWKTLLHLPASTILRYPNQTVDGHHHPDRLNVEIDPEQCHLPKHDNHALIHMANTDGSSATTAQSDITNQDIDPAETQEWLAALEAVIVFKYDSTASRKAQPRRLRD